MQLYNNLQLGIGLRYEVCINRRTEDGLTNGSACTIQKISTVGTRPTGIVCVLFEKADIGKLTRQQNIRLFTPGISKD